MRRLKDADCVGCGAAPAVTADTHMWRPRRFRTELLLVFLGLFLLAQTTSFLITSAVTERNARTQVAESLGVAGGALSRLLEERDRSLLQAGRLLAGDFAFKTAFATEDGPTILSMLGNHRNRIAADAMVLVSLEETIIADTLHPDSAGKDFGHPWLIDRALDDVAGEAAGILFIDGKPMQFIILPLLAPLHEAWIAIGFHLDDEFAASLKSFSMADMTIISRDDGSRDVHASTLPTQYRRVLERAMHSRPPRDAYEMALGRLNYLSLVLPLAAEGERPLYALMQRPLDTVLEPYRDLQKVLGMLFLLGLVATGIGAAVLAGGVAKPLARLTTGARRIAEGDYGQRVELNRRDELGELATAFNEMAHGLADRDRVRNLLGKVVSPQIAEELLSREIRLGGEERVATILFADCRGFTAMSEHLPPTEVLGRLNGLLTALTEVIERHGGVVDKYMGDAVMALFGAPLAHTNDPQRAVACALDMVVAAEEFNHNLPEDERLHISVGVNTGPVVAGNMGSMTRLNYTVIGDAVNLAARVETLTRQYGVNLLVTEHTRDACGDAFHFREVDRVTVKGRGAPVAVFEPLAGTTGALAQ